MAQSKQFKDLKIDAFNGDSEEWAYWNERFKIALRNNGIKNEDTKRDLLLGNLGSQPFKLVFDHARPAPISSLGFTDVIDILRKYYSKTSAPLSQRVIFTRRFRSEDETVNQFELALRSIAGFCEFGDNLNERLRDQFILGINNDRWQLELLRLHAKTDTTLEQVTNTATLLENVDSQQIQLRDTCKTVNKINNNNDKRRLLKKVLHIDQKTQCVRCGNKKHTLGSNCPALDVSCGACGGFNHFARVCLKAGNAIIVKGKKLNSIDKRDSSSNCSEKSFTSINQMKTLKKGSKVMLSVKINKHAISMLYDPGAAFSIISEKIWKEIGAPKLSPAENLNAYTGVPIETVGKTCISVEAFGSNRKLPVTVVKKNDVPLFGLDWVLDFDLPLPPGAKVCTVSNKTPSKEVSEKYVQRIINEFAEVFSPSLGTIKNCQVSFHITPNSVPVFSKPRPVPFALRESVENELKRLVTVGVLEPVDTKEEPIVWASPIVIVVKPSGAIRICADFKTTINRYILPDKYPMPTFDEITSKLTGGQEFSVIDLKDAYLQMEVEPSVQQYLIISTHKGFFKYKRLPFGIKIATGVFQRKMDQILTDLPGVACLLDDVIVTAPTRELHETRVREVLRRFTETGIKVQQSKCKWFQTSVSYLGHRIDKEGIHPTKEHLDALKHMPSPKNIRELRTFLGSVNYYSKFIPHLQSWCVPLYNLLRKETKWMWTEQHERIVSKIRHTLSESDSLAHYDDSLPLILATDASDVGLGAALFLRYDDGTERPLAFASRRLNETECRYSVIEKEALALVFGVKRFEQYLYGRHFHVKTDHKALIKLFGEHDQIPKVVSNRISRWALTLSAYDYSISYQNGKNNQTADLLSRLPLSTTSSSNGGGIDRNDRAHLFHLRLQDLPISQKILSTETKRDQILSKVITYICTRWPEIKELNTDMLPYYKKREELSYENGVLFWLGRLIIPQKLRTRLMDTLHEGHPGIVSMKSKARFQLWWPKIDTDLEKCVEHCTGCQENRAKDAEVPLYSWTMPSEVWSRIHIDFAGPFLGKMWLVVVDARSKWLEIIPTVGTTTKSTINILEDLFSRFGLPRIIVSDNGPQLTSHEFQDFCKRLNIKHARITPYHPKTNGLAERCVRTFKERMNASKADKGTLQEKLNAFLFAYRSTPKRSTGKSPSFMMFGREIRSKIDLLRPDVDSMADKELVQQKINSSNNKERVFQEFDHVWVLNTNGKGFKKGQVIKVNGPYSYIVKIDGTERRCHADQLRFAPKDAGTPTTSTMLLR